jgi:hypothetical protein
VVPVPAGGRFADGVGSVMPCFCRQDLNAVNRPPPSPCAPLDDAAELLVVVLVELVVELPHAASMKETPSADSARAGRMRRLIVGW